MNALTREPLQANETLMTHFIMKAPPPSVPSEINARGMSEGLRIQALKPDYELMLRELEKIGDGWHLRDEHTDPVKRLKSQKILEGNKTSIWHFMRGDTPIGFCCAVKKGFGGDLERIAGRFNSATTHDDDRVNPAKGVEIYKVGLYRDFVGKAYGFNFLPAVQHALLVGQQAVECADILEIKPSEFIYLNTRLTNAVDSREFYSRLGYSYAGQDSWPISTSEIRALQTAVAQLPSRGNGVVRPRPLIPAANFGAPAAPA